MNRFNKNTIKRILISAVWILAGCGTVVLLAASVHRTRERACAGISINISGVSNNFFIDKKEVQEIIDRNTGKMYSGKAIHNFDLHTIETVLKKNVWIKNAELYFDDNNILQAAVEEREPVARIFTTSGNNFYVDSSMMILPLSDKFSARLPVFTGFPSDTKVLSKPDSVLLRQVEQLSSYIVKDPFLMGMIDQIDITAQRSFEMIPKIGNQLILFGEGTDVDTKMQKLKAFYKNIMTKAGWGHYSTINLQFNNQVVAKIRGKDDVEEDSLRAKMLIQLIAETTKRMAEDSIRASLPETERNSDSTIVLQSLQRDEDDTPETPVNNTVLKAKDPMPQQNKVKSEKPKVETVRPKPPTNISHQTSNNKLQTSNSKPAVLNQPKALMPKKIN